MSDPTRSVGRLAKPSYGIAALTVLVLLLSGGPLAAQSSLIALEEQAFKEAAALAEPSIVRIETVGGLDVVGELLTGAGPTTGVAVSPDGYIITSSFNFVSRPAGIIVTLADGRRFPAVEVAGDSARMLTLLKIDLPADSSPLPPLAAVPRDDVRVGQWAIALGRTYEHEFPNLSVGIVSAVDRVWGKAFQTDAKISPANYGGPLVDISGKCLGILVPLSPDKADETAGVEWYDGGIGFAIPLSDVYGALDRLKSGEDLQPGLMGVGFPDQSVLAGAAKVDHVRPESPADKAGILVDDLIVEADGRPVARVPDLKHVLGRKYAGDHIALVIQRGDQRLPVEVELAAELPVYSSAYLGILPVRLAGEDAQPGVEVREVLPDSPAAQAGVQKRDRVLSIDGAPVATDSELLHHVARLVPGATCTLQVSRQGTEQTLTLTTTAVPADLPAELASVNVPAPAAGVVPAELLGRFTGTLAGNEERKFWRYVPEQYNPAHQYGLVVWLHPSGDTLERVALQRWQEHCSRRGIVLVAPLAADIGGWTPGEAEFVRDLVEDTRQKLTIDPRRIVVHGHGAGGTFALQVGFKYRELFRGISASAAPLREAPPDNDPDFRTQVCLVVSAEDAEVEPIEQSRELLAQMGYPVTLLSHDEGAAEYPSAAIIDQLALWIDLLDRI